MQKSFDEWNFEDLISGPPEEWFRKSPPDENTEAVMNLVQTDNEQVNIDLLNRKRILLQK